MKLISLAADNYRNLSGLFTELDEGVNVICGANAAGKTNLLEAVWMLTGAKSFRTSRDADLIMRGRESAVLNAAFYSQSRRQELRLSVTTEGRAISLNKAPETRASAAAGEFCCVCFSPSHMALIEGSPAERRRFLDTALCQLYPAYLGSAKRYARLVNQKNALLKSCYTVSAACELVDSFDDELASLAQYIVKMRIDYTESINRLAKKYYSVLSGEREDIELRYRSTLFDGNPNVADAAAAFAKNRAADLKCGFCTVGPHRDELLISLCSESGRQFGSQGQKRSIVLAMKLAEAEQFEAVSGERPVLLLDDVLSELDEKRQTYLIDCLVNTQTIITGCDEEAIKSRIAAKILKIADGRLL